MSKNINPEELREVTSLLGSEYGGVLSATELAFLQYGYLYAKLVLDPALAESRERKLAEFNAEFRRRVVVPREQ